MWSPDLLLLLLLLLLVLSLFQRGLRLCLQLTELFPKGLGYVVQRKVRLSVLSSRGERGNIARLLLVKGLCCCR